MRFDIADRVTLRHNPLNAVTVIVERVSDPTGATMVRKELRAPVAAALDDRWAASSEPDHWNYWRRESEAYQDDRLRRSLEGTGLDMAEAQVVEHADGAVLWLEDVSGTPGSAFSLGDHVAVATGLGRWQAHGPLSAPWASRRFLREYSASKPVRLSVVDDDGAWAQPLVAETWPAGLREGWRRLLAHRGYLLDLMERLPRTCSHLDTWVSNEIRRPTGEVVLLDWAFVGDGAVGEDIGNHVPDAVFDLFWPAEDIGELDAACFGAYLAGLREAGWDGEDREVRLGLVASCVKYTWLLPLMLDQAGQREHHAYHQAVDAHELYRQRGLAFAHLIAWCDEALLLSEST